MDSMTAARAGLRDLLRPETAAAVPEIPPEFLPELTALIAVSSSRLVARQFSSATDRRIGAFVEEAADAAHWPPTLSPMAFEQLIRWTLGDVVRLIPADQITPGQLYLLGLLTAQQQLDGAGLERLLDSAEPLARALVEHEWQGQTETPLRPAPPPNV